VYRNDVEKRWHDPRALRAAVAYVCLVVVVAAVIFTGQVTFARGQLAWSFATPATLFLGALGAFVKTYRDWRAQRTWPIWHGAGWALLALTLLAFAIPSAAIG
jgi:peptidoglycan/LPS O-acetylase OafA/YrhL